MNRITFLNQLLSLSAIQMKKILQESQSKLKAIEERKQSIAYAKTFELVKKNGLIEGSIIGL